MTDEEQTPLAWAWAQQGVWSRAAGLLKRRIDRARRAALLLGIAAATLAVAAVQLGGVSAPAGRVLSAAAAVAAGLAALLQRRVGIEQISDWTAARAAAEGLKSQVHSYLAGGTAYAGEDRDRRLSVETRGIVEAAGGVLRHLPADRPLARELPPVSDVGSYLAHRVDHQIERYYRPGAAVYERRVRRLRMLGDVLGLAAVLLGGLAATLKADGLAAWVPVVTTIGASVTAYVAAARYDHHVVEFLRTAQRLEHLRREHLDAPGRAPAAFVDSCEAAISAENQGWLARWDSPGEPG